MDGKYIDKLIALGSDPEQIAVIHQRAMADMEAGGAGYTLHNGCAATLSEFLNAAGIAVPITLGAGRLARRLEQGRSWYRVNPGEQRGGDVGVTFDRTDPPGADHVYLVVERIDGDAMIIADNQSPVRHRRLASGGGKTPTEYFLRAPAAPILYDILPGAPKADYPDEDEDTNSLTEPFADDGEPV